MSKIPCRYYRLGKIRVHWIIPGVSRIIPGISALMPAIDASKGNEMTTNIRRRPNCTARTIAGGTKFKSAHFKRIAAILMGTALACGITAAAGVAGSERASPYAPEYDHKAFNLGGAIRMPGGDSALVRGIRNATAPKSSPSEEVSNVGAAVNSSPVADIRTPSGTQPRAEVPTSSPEPGTVALFGLGFGAVAMIHRRRRKS
jgi:hypothetical protein